MLTWTLTLTCDDCGAVLTYTDERPPWQQESPDPALLQVATDYVAAHPTGTVRLWPLGPLPEEDRVPAYVSTSIWGSRNFVDPPPTRHYVTCPACEGRAYRESGRLRTAPEPEREPADA